MLSLERLLPLLAIASFLLPLPVLAQIITETVFDPDDAIGFRADVSGDNDCGLDQQFCGDYLSSVRATHGEVDQQFSTLGFGFTGGTPCAFYAPPPTYPVVTMHSRFWNECEDGRVNSYEVLDTTSLPGPDYGLKRLRICTDNSRLLAGVEARFFKLPHLGPNGPGQDVVTRSFECDGCVTWQDWSACPRGKAAGSVHLYSRDRDTGGIQGVQLTCYKVVQESPRGR